LKQQECTATVHDYDPIPGSDAEYPRESCGECYRDGYDAAVREIVAWLRTCPQTCDCGYKDCHFTNTMTVDELADAIERGEHKGAR
jgi:hypothetical protein